MRRALDRISVIGLCLVIGFSIAFSLPRDFLGDLAVFIGAGRLASSGQNPYGVAEITPRGPAGIPFPNLSPPVSVLFFQPIAWLDPTILFRVWYVANLALYLALLIVLSRAYPNRPVRLRFLWALAIFPLWFTLGIGQVHVVLLALATATWLALQRRRDDLAGLALGLLIAWKPNFLLWPVLLYLSGRRRASLIAAAVTIVVSVWPAVVYGPSIYAEWLQASMQTATAIGGYGMVSFLARDVGVPWLGLPVSAAIALGAIAWVWLTKPTAQRVGEIALTISLLALPVTNAAYFLLLVPIFLSRPWTAPMTLAAALLLVPWQFIVMTRLPWPYAVVLALLLDLPPVNRQFRIGAARFGQGDAEAGRAENPQ